MRYLSCGAHVHRHDVQSLRHLRARARVVHVRVDDAGAFVDVDEDGGAGQPGFDEGGDGAEVGRGGAAGAAWLVPPAIGATRSVGS